jgi:hypothetical protein
MSCSGGKKRYGQAAVSAFGSRIAANLASDGKLKCFEGIAMFKFPCRLFDCMVFMPPRAEFNAFATGHAHLHFFALPHFLQWNKPAINRSNQTSFAIL